MNKDQITQSNPTATPRPRASALPSPKNSAFDFDRLVDLCRQTHEDLQHAAVRAVDKSLAGRNWLFGWYIVEYEQKGADRAAYGKRLIDRLSKRLASFGIRGVSTTRLKLYRQFYMQYRDIGPTALDQSHKTLSVNGLLISPTASDQFGATISTTLSSATYDAMANYLQILKLGWSHYVELLTIDNPDERHFYEIEAVQNQWSVRELQRQIASSLYERLALSRDKDEVKRLARVGQVVEKAADLIKNPLVLEFLGLPEHPHYSEQELETAIIDKIESFLLELGKGRQGTGQQVGVLHEDRRE